MTRFTVIESYDIDDHNGAGPSTFFVMDNDPAYGDACAWFDSREDAEADAEHRNVTTPRAQEKP